MHSPWVISLGNHVTYHAVTYELSADSFDEFAKRKDDWLVTNYNRQPLI